MLWRQVWGIAAFALITLSAGAAAQTPQLSIAGLIRDASTQEPIGEAAVELRTLSGEQAGQSTESGSDGAFRLSATIGNYLVTVEHSGYETRTMVVGNDPSNLLVSLRRLPDAVPTTARISTHELSVPRQARGAFEKASSLLGKSPPECEQAIREFRRAIKEFPGYYEAYGEMSIAQFRLGDAASAEESLKKSIALSDGRYAKGMTLLAELLNSRNRFAEAEPVARRAIVLDEASAPAHCQLARALSGLKRPSEAVLSANRALELEPRNPMFSLVRGNIHLQQRDFAAAVRDFDTYLQQLPNGPQGDLVRAARDRAQGVLSARHAQQVPGP